MEEKIAIEQVQYPGIYKLKWLVDVTEKVNRLIEYVDNNIDYSLSHGQNEDDLKFQLLTKNKFLELNREIGEGISEELEFHPAWPWLNEIPGLDPLLSGKVIGAIRFWPPKNNVANPITGKERYAHSRGAILMFCGLAYSKGKDDNSNPNYKLKKYLYSQVEKFLEVENKYYDYFIEYRNELEKNSNEATSEASSYMSALKSTATLFTIHLWEVVQRELGVSIPEATFNTPLQEKYSDPWGMIG
jgi:hypothetical protein